MVLGSPDLRETCPYHFGLRLFTKVRRFSCGPSHCLLDLGTGFLVGNAVNPACTLQAAEVDKYTVTGLNTRVFSSSSVVIVAIVVLLFLDQSLAGHSGRLTWVMFRQLPEQRCPVLPLHAMFRCLPIAVLQKAAGKNLPYSSQFLSARLEAEARDVG